MKPNHLIIPTLALALSANNVATAASQDAKRPNILFITIDDMNDWAGYLEHSHPDTQTPNLDRLASRGVAFQNGYCNAIMSNPSRTSLLSGLYPATSGIYNNAAYCKRSPALKEVVTMVEHLKSNGYHTVNIGKLYHGSNRSWGEADIADAAKYDHIWSEYDDRKKVQKEYQKRYVAQNPDKRVGMLNTGKAHAKATGYYNSGIPYSEDHIKAIDGGSTLDWGAHPCENEYFYATILPIQTVNSLQQASAKEGEYKDKPFFISCGLGKPHLSWYAPEDNFAKFPIDQVQCINEAEELADCDDLPTEARAVSEIDKSYKNSKFHLLKKYNKTQEATAAYLACINYVDYSVGMILDAYDAMDKETRDNTIIFLMSDHGFHVGEKARYGKGSLWEETCRIPFIVVAPGITESNSNCYSPVSFIDIYPTIVELAGLQSPAHKLEGRAMVPVLKEVKTKWDYPAITSLNQGSHTVRTSEWRFTQYPDGGQELYDHRNEVDQAERVNLANDPKYSKVVEKMKAMLPQNAAQDAKELKK